MESIAGNIALFDFETAKIKNFRLIGKQTAGARSGPECVELILFGDN